MKTACFSTIIIKFFFLSDWKWETSDGKQNMQWKHAKIVQNLQYNIRPLFAMGFVFLFENV